MLKVLLLLGLLLIPGSDCSFAGTNTFKGLIPSKIGIEILRADDYFIPALSIENCQRIEIDTNYVKDSTVLYYDFNLPKILIDVDGEIGVGGSIGIGWERCRAEAGFYAIIGKNQHEGDKDWRAYIGMCIFKDGD